jgi:hypothetical protein
MDTIKQMKVGDEIRYRQPKKPFFQRDIKSLFIIPTEVDSYTTFWGKYQEEICGGIAFIAVVGIVWIALAMRII